MLTGGAGACIEAQRPCKHQPAGSTGQRQPSLTASQACGGAVNAHSLESVGQGGLAAAAGAVKLQAGQQSGGSSSSGSGGSMLF